MGIFCSKPIHETTRDEKKKWDPIDELTDAQLDEFRDAFRQFDSDGGGSIDASELKELMISVGQSPSDEEVLEMVRIADADGSGSVDFNEFVTLMAHKMTEVESLDLVRDAFKIFDESGDGYISPEEMRKLMINVGEPVTLSDCMALCAEVDGNGDGQINFDEFSKVVLSKKAVAGCAPSGVSDSSHLAGIGTSHASLRHAGAAASAGATKSPSRKKGKKKGKSCSRPNSPIPA